MLNHELCKTLPVNQYNFVRAAIFCCGLSSGRESAGCDENAFACTLRIKSPFEIANRSLSHRSFPAFSLDIDCVKTQTIFIDHAINSTITRLSNSFTRLNLAAAVAHREQQINN